MWKPFIILTWLIYYFLCTGLSLKNLVASDYGKRLCDPTTLTALAFQGFATLDKLHSKGIAHLDIKRKWLHLSELSGLSVIWVVSIVSFQVVGVESVLLSYDVISDMWCLLTCSVLSDLGWLHWHKMCGICVVCVDSCCLIWADSRHKMCCLVYWLEVCCLMWVVSSDTRGVVWNGYIH